MSQTRTVEGREYSGAVECLCLKRKRFRSFRRSIPPAFRNANLARTRPQLDRHENQGAILEMLRSAPGESYALCGLHRTGKSHFGWCLARSSYLAGYDVKACNLAMLLDQYRALERPLAEGETARKPLVTSGDLVVQNARFCLLLQEFDKPRPTRFATERLFELIDTAFNYGHQLIITSNLAIPALSDHWSECGSNYGRGIVTRIEERCREINMWASDADETVN